MEGETLDDEKQTDSPAIPQELIERRIYVFRGQKVMIDSDLAELYQVTTGNLNLAVHRNKARFPQDFTFRLSASEAKSLRLHSARPKGRGGRRTLPYAFTEQGVAMLSSVLRSERAVLVNIAIMRAFVRQALPFGRVVDDLLSMNGEVQKKGDRHARVEKPIAREMVLQISHCVQPEIPKEGDVRKFAEGGRKDPAGTLQADGSRIG